MFRYEKLRLDFEPRNFFTFFLGANPISSLGVALGVFRERTPPRLLLELQLPILPFSAERHRSHLGLGLKLCLFLRSQNAQALRPRRVPRW